MTTSNVLHRRWCRLQQALWNPDIPHLRGSWLPKKKPVQELDLAALGIDSGAVGKSGARQETVRITEAEERQAGEVIEDEGDAHEKIVEFLGELKVV